MFTQDDVLALSLAVYAKNFKDCRRIVAICGVEVITTLCERHWVWLHGFLGLFPIRSYWLHLFAISGRRHGAALCSLEQLCRDS